MHWKKSCVLLKKIWNHEPRKKMSKFTKKEDEICDLLAWLACHADEDCPGQYRTKHFKNALDKACSFLSDSGWYDHNKNRPPKFGHKKKAS